MEPWRCALEVCVGSLPWKSALEVCLGSLPWKCALEVCFGSLPWKSALKMCLGSLPHVAGQGLLSHFTSKGAIFGDKFGHIFGHILEPIWTYFNDESRSKGAKRHNTTLRNLLELNVFVRKNDRFKAVKTTKC